MTLRTAFLPGQVPFRPASMIDRRIFADLALFVSAAAMGVLFAVSPETLEAFGIGYISSGGGPLSKVHPGTILVVVALGLRCLSARHPLRTLMRLATADRGVVMMLGAVVITFGYAAAFAHTPVTPMIDTFVLPILVFLLLRDLDPAISRLLALFVGFILCANAAIAFAESLKHFHIIQIDVPAGATADPTGGGTFDWRAQLAIEWRATALLGHPLSNGLIIGAFVVCLAARGTSWIPAIVKLPVALLQAVSMVTFGARTALVLMVVSLAWLGAQRCVAFLCAGQRLEPRTVGLALVMLVVVVGAGTALVGSGFADNTIERFQNDQGSATTRLTMLDLFTPLSAADIVLGPDPDQVATLQRLEGLEFGIESSWVGLALSYGLLVAATLMLGLAAFMRSVHQACGPGAGLVLLGFVVQASVAASMSTKTTIFGLTVALVLLFLRKQTDRLPARTAYFVGAE